MQVTKITNDFRNICAPLLKKLTVCPEGYLPNPIYLLCGVPTLTRAWTGDEPAGGKRYSTRSPLA